MICHLQLDKKESFNPIPFFVRITFVFSLISQLQLNAQSPVIESTGDILLFALPATALGSTLIIGDKEGTWQFTKGFVLNQALTLGLKYATDKKRPFNNGDRAFPSGHTSTTFQSASFIQRRYGWKYGIPAYALASFTGFSRINAQKHDGWDVLAGALIGVGSTYLFTTPYQKEHMELTLSSWENQYLLGFTYKF
jgi:membrane-associated phospholipid phosphatase